MKYSDDLSVVGGKLKYKKLDIIPRDDVNNYLRRKMFDKKSDVPFSRDACFHIIKKTVGAGIGRRQIMEFIRSQKTFTETKSALPQPKVKSGVKMKKYTLETDLIFIRVADLIAANPRFKKTQKKKETYIVSTCEKTTGLTRVNYVTQKKQKMVTPIVEEHIKSICKTLRVKPSSCAIRLDKGGEFGLVAIKKLIPDAEYVPMGSSVENRNKLIQRNMFRILRNRRAVTITSALSQSEKIINNTFNSVHSATPNEIIEKIETPAEKQKNVVSQYNKTRKQYEAGDRRTPFKVNDYCRIQIKKPKSGIEYKSYKGMTFTQRVFKIQKVTKGLRNKQIKYRVNGKWYMQDKLLKSGPVDKESEQIKIDRDNAQERVDVRKAEEEERKAYAKEKQNLEQMDKRVPRAHGKKPKPQKSRRATYEELVAHQITKTTRSGRPRRAAAVRGVQKRLARKQRMRAIDERL